MNAIDAYLALLFSSLATHHPAVDIVLSAVSNSNFLKGQALMLMFWWVWFYPRAQQLISRRVLIVALVGCVLALGIGRVLVATLPPRLRPINNPEYHFQLPFSVRFQRGDASSFPSDHAVLFFALATGIFLADRRVGSLAFGYVSAIVCFPRLWLGYHYFSDIVVGALIGAGVVLLINQRKIGSAISSPLLRLMETKPQFFYMGLFLFSYQVSELFDSIRDALGLLHAFLP